MAEMDSVEDSELDAVEVKPEQPETQIDEEAEFPEHLKVRLKGKTRAQIAQIVADQEKIMSRQGQEVGEVRRLADELLKSQLSKKAEEEKPEEVDFFENPKEAIRQAIANSPDVIEAKQSALKLQQEAAQREFVRRHPDYGQIVQDGEFIDWVNSSKKRAQMYNEAINYDVDSGDELLSTWKQLKSVKQQQVSKAVSETEKKARDESLKVAAVETGGTGETSRKVYRRADLMNLRIRDPLKYEAMLPDIEKAYAEGRIR